MWICHLIIDFVKLYRANDYENIPLKLFLLRLCITLILPSIFIVQKLNDRLCGLCCRNKRNSTILIVAMLWETYFSTLNHSTHMQFYNVYLFTIKILRYSSHWVGGILIIMREAELA